MADSIWWTKMLHKEDFCAHFCEMTDAEIVADIRKSIASFMQQRDEGKDFGAMMVKKAKNRIEFKSAINSENGRKGGRPRKDDNGAVAVVSPKVVDEDSHRTAAASLAYSGQNGLVRLSDDEYNVLLQKIGNKRKADKLIDDLDYALAEGKKFKQPHLHVLTHWQSYREDKAEEAAETAKARAAANAEAFGNVDRRTPYQKNQDDLLRLYQETSAMLKAM